jgi:UDP-N-acetylglucosamine:LPS N-acetylglucosamine transferase
MLPQARLEGGLEHEVTMLLADAARLQRMRDSLARLARPDAAANLARLVIQMAGAREAVPA